MPNFLVTDPQGQRYKLTTPEGTTPEQAESELARSILHPQMPQALHDALGAVRSQGKYYGGAPVAPGPPAVALESMAVNPARFPVVTGPRMEEPPGMGLIGANQNLRFPEFVASEGGAAPRPEINERLAVLNKLIAKRDLMPRFKDDGGIWFRSLGASDSYENQIINEIGWSRAPGVELEQEMSLDSLTSRRAWERNIKHWHELASPSSLEEGGPPSLR